MAAPIIDNKGIVIAAIGVSGTVSQLPTAKIPKTGEHLRKVGKKISREIGFGGAYPVQTI